uniref:Uncharacterized protein n=1 Tax=Romanomermis culicivorax TaxID=13658 RepID=A0A915KGG0_ROMCU
MDDESVLWTNVESQMVFPANHFYATPFDDPLKSIINTPDINNIPDVQNFTGGLFSCHSVNLGDSRRHCFTSACRGFDLVCKFSVQWKCYGGQVLYRFKTVRFRPPLPHHRHRNGDSHKNLLEDYANHGIYIGLALSDNNVSALYDRLILCEWLNRSGEITNGDRKGTVAMTTKFRTYVMHPGIGYPVPFRDDSVENIDVTSTSRDFGCKIVRKENVNGGRTSQTENLSFVWGYMNAGKDYPALDQK